jgi:CheY-like chemotaxis protein
VNPTDQIVTESQYQPRTAMLQKTILLIEGNENDVILFRAVMKRINSPHGLQCLNDGEDAVHYLGGEGKYRDRSEFPLPALIFLAPRLPRLDGFDVLQWMGQRPALQHIPAILYSSTDSREDVQRALELGARSHVRKTSDLCQLQESLRATIDEWVGPLPETPAR